MGCGCLRGHLEWGTLARGICVVGGKDRDGWMLGMISRQGRKGVPVTKVTEVL